MGARWSRRGDDEGERVGAGLVSQEVGPGQREYLLAAFECWDEVGVADIPWHGGTEERMR